MLLWVTLAFAARVSEQQMQRWLVELVPAVEAAAGRRFVERPELVLDDRARVEKLLLDNAVRFERFAPGSMPTAPTIDPGIIALYSLNTQRVYVVTESVLSIFERVVDDTALLEPFVRCAIAHELTHALQHQHGLMALDAWSDPAVEALIEGQATLVARSACGSRAGADLSDGVTEVDIVSSLDPDVEQSFEYGYGRRYVEGLVAPFGDHRAVWVAFQTPPTKQEILRSVRETLAPRWNDLTPLSEVTQALADGAEVVSEGTVSPAELLGGLSAGGVSVSSMFPAEGGLISRRSDERNSAMAAVFLLEKPNDAVKWVAARRGDVASGTMRMYAGKVGYIQRRAVRDQHPAFKESALDRMFGATVFLSSRGQYRELWLARGNVLVGLSSWALAGNAPKLETAALSLLDAYRDNLPAPPVATTAPPEAAPPLRSGRFVIDRMLSLAVAGDLAGCAALAATSAPSVWEAQRGRVYEVGYMCAARVENVATCDALLAADDFRPDYNDAVRHANLLRGTPRQADGIAILERSIATGAQARQYRDSALAETYADIKRWADVRRVLTEGDPLPRSRIHAATALYNSGAKAEARALAKAACVVGDASQKAAAICR